MGEKPGGAFPVWGLEGAKALGGKTCWITKKGRWKLGSRGPGKR